MTNERSDRVWEKLRDATEKYDYFVAGLSTALTAFVAQGLPASKPTAVATFIETASAIALCVAVGLAAERIRSHNTALHVNHRLLYHNEAKGGLTALLAKGGGTHMINESTGDVFTAADASTKIQSHAKNVSELTSELGRWTKRAERASTGRDWALMVGLGLYVAARIAKAYL